MITVIGGVYREVVVREQWDEYFGSAGRAAEAITKLGSEVELSTYLDADAKVSIANRNRDQRYRISFQEVERVPRFNYIHGLGQPSIVAASGRHPTLQVKADRAVIFGMLAGNAEVDADYVVYDPQNVDGPQGFMHSGSRANHLALILNRYEAAMIMDMDPLAPAEDLARAIAEREAAEVVVLKGGPYGAVVLHNGELDMVSSYQTSSVFKVGSGDVFVAVFAQGWLEEGLTPVAAADRASRATAFYVENRYPPTAEDLANFKPEPVKVSERGKSDDARYLAKVYLAGPFFTMGQLWVIEEARRSLASMDIQVLSPYHLVGPGPADEVVAEDLRYLDESDLVLAIGDGMDAGTIFEVGYAKARGKPVIFYAENEVGEDIKMLEGSNCQMVKDFPTAIYKTVWEAMAL
ncbi:MULTISPECIES: PfkB family carbohydrate kinase [Luteibacter]|uniref:PfkB family carbohydrate kinase n=1 Tax=Luteibacter TaxID=242605 RepID=UPI0005663DF9|nr:MULTISPECIES: PfkB family carbohydrate kinase [unclassified Luteibacter]